MAISNNHGAASDVFMDVLIEMLSRTDYLNAMSKFLDSESRAASWINTIRTIPIRCFTRESNCVLCFMKIPLMVIAFFILRISGVISYCICSVCLKTPLMGNLI